MLLDPLALLAPLDPVALLDLLVRRERLESLVPPAQLDGLGLLDHEDPLDPLDLLELLVALEQRAHKALEASVERPESVDLPDHLVTLVRVEPRVSLDLADRPDLVVSAANLDPQDPLDQLVLVA